MHFFVALLYISLMAAPECTSLSTKGESIRNTIHNTINVAQITLVHINKLRTMLLVSPQIEVSTPAIEGLTGISHDLGLLGNELQSPFTELLGQIQADMASLEGRVRSLASTMNCPIQARPTAETKDHSFPHSRLHQTLMKVQRYLESLLQNKDKLKVC